MAGALILHDNARPHIAGVTRNLSDYVWEMLPYASLQSRHDSMRLQLIPKVKGPMRGRRFSSLEELSTDDIRAINMSMKVMSCVE